MEELSQIIRGCIRNDRISQEKLYKQFYVSLFYLCRKFFHQDHEAVEALNDGMLKVFSNIHTYREDKGKFFNWIYTIVRNAALDKLKKSVMQPLPLQPGTQAEETDFADASYNPLQVMEQKDTYRLLDSLSPSTRVVCSLFYLEGYSIKDIAEQLEIAAGTVKWHLSEGRKKLLPLFEKHLND